MASWPASTADCERLEAPCDGVIYVGTIKYALVHESQSSELSFLDTERAVQCWPKHVESLQGQKAWSGLSVLFLNNVVTVCGVR